MLARGPVIPDVVQDKIAVNFEILRALRRPVVVRRLAMTDRQVVVIFDNGAKGRAARLLGRNLL